jgi:hypothetical protein
VNDEWEAGFVKVVHARRLASGKVRYQSPVMRFYERAVVTYGVGRVTRRLPGCGPLCVFGGPRARAAAAGFIRAVLTRESSRAFACEVVRHDADNPRLLWRPDDLSPSVVSTRVDEVDVLLDDGRLDGGGELWLSDATVLCDAVRLVDGPLDLTPGGHVELDEETEAKVTELAGKLGWTPVEVVKKAVFQYSHRASLLWDAKGANPVKTITEFLQAEFPAEDDDDDDDERSCATCDHDRRPESWARCDECGVVDEPYNRWEPKRACETCYHWGGSGWCRRFGNADGRQAYCVGGGFEHWKPVPAADLDGGDGQ